MTPADQAALWSVCQGQWKRLQLRWSSVKLPWQEWEDIKTTAIEHVFAKAGRYDPAKGSPEGWAFMVMHRTIMNELRRRLPDKRRSCHHWRTNLLLARPIRVTVRQTGRWGEDTTIVEPDILDEHGDPLEALDLAAFRSRLDKHDAAIMDRLSKDESISEVGRQVGQPYQRVHMRAARLRQLWRRYIDTGLLPEQPVARPARTRKRPVPRLAQVSWPTYLCA